MITKIEILPNDLHVHFSGENSEIFPNIWLRDHAKDEQNWDKRSSQRKTFTASLDLNLKIKEISIVKGFNIAKGRHVEIYIFQNQLFDLSN